MRLSTTRFSHEGRSYSLISIPRREAVARALKAWFETKVDGPTEGQRIVLESPGMRTVVKLSAQAKREFDTVLVAEDMCTVTPMAGAALLEEGSSSGLVALELIKGAYSIKTLSSTRMTDNDRRMIQNGTLYALGLMHDGDKNYSLLYQNPDQDGILIIPNCPPTEARIDREDRAEIRFVGLKNASIVEYDPTILPEMALDLLRVIDQLAQLGLIHPSEIPAAMAHYFEANQRQPPTKIVQLLKQQAAVHQELPCGGTVLSLP